MFGENSVILGEVDHRFALPLTVILFEYKMINNL